MQKQGIVLAIAVLLIAGLTGCKNGSVLPCKNCENYATLQGTIMDAVTGERIGGTVSGKDQDMQIYLIQGATIRTPTSFIGDAGNSLVGEYSFTNIPAGSNFTIPANSNTTGPDYTYNSEFKVVVIKSGYQRFEADVILANIENKIGNIYLFPEGYHAPDYTFRVVYNGAPVDNATVLFKPVVTSNVALTDTNDVLAATDGLLPSLSGLTDSQGLVTFPGSELGLGAAYKVVVLPMEFENTPLAYYVDAAARIIGLGNVEDIISLGDLSPGTNPYGLYVTSISNAKSNQVVASGTLQMTFSRPVTLTGSFNAISNSPTGILGVPPANASLSGDGLTLTLTPSWATAPTAGETGTLISYSNGTAFLSVQGYPDSQYNVFGGAGLVDANGTLISGTVNLTTP